MSKSVKRGYFPEDEREFGSEAVQTLYCAGRDLYYLLNQGYQIKGASQFVGNHYLLSERQRLALARAISPKQSIESRREKEITDLSRGVTVNIDGFNTIITLEVALSDSTLLKGMDGTIRDLASLRGTYRLIDKTQSAIVLIGRQLEADEVGKTVFYLDAPVSNSGRLKQQILELLDGFHFEVQVEIINNVDSVLETMENVITSDAIILDKCQSWYNFNKKVIENHVKDCRYIDFSLLE